MIAKTFAKIYAKKEAVSAAFCRFHRFSTESNNVADDVTPDRET